MALHYSEQFDLGEVVLTGLSGPCSHQSLWVSSTALGGETWRGNYLESALRPCVLHVMHIKIAEALVRVGVRAPLVRLRTARIRSIYPEDVEVLSHSNAGNSFVVPAQAEQRGPQMIVSPRFGFVRWKGTRRCILLPCPTCCCALVVSRNSPHPYSVYPCAASTIITQASHAKRGEESLMIHQGVLPRRCLARIDHQRDCLHARRRSSFKHYLTTLPLFLALMFIAACQGGRCSLGRDATTAAHVRILKVVALSARLHW